MSIQKSLSDKLMFSIYIKDSKNVFEFYRKYVKHLDSLPENKIDQEDLLKIQTEYSTYFSRRFG